MSGEPVSLGTVLPSDLHYDVEAILDHAVDGGQYRFLIRWLGFSEDYDTWESIDNLNCHDILRAYVARSGMDSSVLDELPDMVVPSDEVLRSGKRLMRPLTSEERENGLTPYQIVDEVHHLRAQQSYYSDSTVRVIHSFVKMPVSDVIILYPMDYHAYVVYYRPGGTSLVTDGADGVFDSAILKRLKRRFGSVRQVRFLGQRLDDHCGTSAVLIMLEFLRLSRVDGALDQVEELRGPSSLQELLIKRWHPVLDSENVHRWQPVLDVNNDKCSKCGLSFAKCPLKQRKQSLLNHERACDGQLKKRRRR